jgi:hypothetical protein
VREFHSVVGLFAPVGRHTILPHHYLPQEPVGEALRHLYVHPVSSTDHPHHLTHTNRTLLEAYSFRLPAPTYSERPFITKSMCNRQRS